MSLLLFLQPCLGGPFSSEELVRFSPANLRICNILNSQMSINESKKGKKNISSLLLILKETHHSWRSDSFAPHDIPCTPQVQEKKS